MTGSQKATLLILSCAVVIVLVALSLLLQDTSPPMPGGTPSPFVVYTSTPAGPSTRTPGTSPTPVPIMSETPTSVGTTTPDSGPTDTPVQTPTATRTQEPTATQTLPPTATPTLRPAIPADVTVYLEQFVGYVAGVHDMQLMGGSVQIDQATVDELRGVYRQLHEVEVPEDAEEMHLAFIIYVSVLEEKCLCHIFTEMHAADAQGQYYRECETRATNLAIDILSNRFIPSREIFLQRYGLNAVELGFPY